MIKSSSGVSEFKRKNEVHRTSEPLCSKLKLDQVHRMISMTLEK